LFAHGELLSRSLLLFARISGFAQNKPKALILVAINTNARKTLYDFYQLSETMENPGCLPQIHNSHTFSLQDLHPFGWRIPIITGKSLSIVLRMNAKKEVYHAES
jgi:hypothetical protein